MVLLVVGGDYSVGKLFLGLKSLLEHAKRVE